MLEPPLALIISSNHFAFVEPVPCPLILLCSSSSGGLQRFGCENLTSPFCSLLPFALVAYPSGGCFRSGGRFRSGGCFRSGGPFCSGGHFRSGGPFCSGGL